MRQLTVFGTVVAAIALAGSSAAAQAPAQTAPKEQQSQAPKKPKVWTDDNISSVRSSSDVYQDQQASEKTAQQASEPQQAATTAKNATDDGAWPIPQAKSAKEADDLIARDKQNLQDQQEYIQQTEKELATAPDSDKKRLQWRIQSRSDVVSRLQRDISALQTQKDTLAKQPQPGANSNAAAQPQSQ